MPTAYNYLEITDGDLSAVFMHASGTPTNYTLVWDTWAPSIAVPRAGELGLPYTATNEEWRFNIIGSTPALCLQYLQTINALFERAWRWWKKRERVNTTNSPVLIKYQLKGSTLSVPLQDVVIIDADRAPILLPTDFTAVGDFYRIAGLKVNFTRKNGLWLGESEFDSVDATNAPGPMTITYAEHAQAHDPVDVTIGMTVSGGLSGGSGVNGIIAFANESAYLAVLTSFTGATSTADSTNLAVGGTVGRVTTSTSNASISANLFPNDAEYLAIYLNIRNNSTSIDCILQGRAETAGGRLILASEVTLRAINPAIPQTLLLGLWRVDQDDSFTNLTIFYRSTSGTPTIDIDYGAAIWCGKATSIVAVNNVTPGGIHLDHSMLTRQTGVTRDTNVPAKSINYSGNPHVFYGGHYTYFSALVMLTQSNFWTVSNIAGTTSAQYTLSATRTKGYLTPE